MFTSKVTDTKVTDTTRTRQGSVSIRLEDQYGSPTYLEIPADVVEAVRDTLTRVIDLAATPKHVPMVDYRIGRPGDMIVRTIARDTFVVLDERRYVVHLMDDGRAVLATTATIIDAYSRPQVVRIPTAYGQRLDIDGQVFEVTTQRVPGGRLQDVSPALVKVEA